MAEFYKDNTLPTRRNVDKINSADKTNHDQAKNTVDSIIFKDSVREIKCTRNPRGLLYSPTGQNDLRIKSLIWETNVCGAGHKNYFVTNSSI